MDRREGEGAYTLGRFQPVRTPNRRGSAKSTCSAPEFRAVPNATTSSPAARGLPCPTCGTRHADSAHTIGTVEPGGWFPATTIGNQDDPSTVLPFGRGLQAAMPSLASFPDMPGKSRLNGGFSLQDRRSAFGSMLWSSCLAIVDLRQASRTWTPSRGKPEAWATVVPVAVKPSTLGPGLPVVLTQLLTMLALPGVSRAGVASTLLANSGSFKVV